MILRDPWLAKLFPRETRNIFLSVIREQVQQQGVIKNKFSYRVPWLGYHFFPEIDAGD